MSRIRPPAGREESARSATHLTLVSDLSARSSGPAGKHARVTMPLKDDVLKFASEIGLAASGGGASGGGFDDRDFRPPTTKASSGKQPREGERAKGGKRKRDAAEKRKRGKKPREGAKGEAPSPSPKPAGREEARAQQHHVRFDGGGGENGGGGHRGKPVGPDPAEQRAWNEGAGPIPDSLLHDKPTSLEGLEDVLSSGNWYEAYDELASRAASKGLGAKGGRKKKKGKKKRFDDGGEGVDEAEEESRRNRLMVRAEGLTKALTQRTVDHLKRHGGQDAAWLMTAKAKGTTRDKIAAASLLVQQNVATNLDSLEMLVNWVSRNKGSRDGIGSALDALSELFSTTVLPDRKLKHFSDQPLLDRVSSDPSQEDDRILIVCHVEDRVKALYIEFISGIEVLTKDNLDFLKQRAIKTAFALLKAKPEQEQRLLSILVNKLGDPSRKIASNAVHFLHMLLEDHPGMKVVVVETAENFLFRPGLAQRAQYTAVIFLNQIVLSKNEFHGGSKLAEKLINLYFGFFQVLITPGGKPNRGEGDLGERKAPSGGGKGGEKGGSGGRPKPKGDAMADSKILGALLTGANRAFPFVSDQEIDALIERHSPKLFQLVHGANFGTCVQALILLYQLYQTRMSLSDRYYRALYSVLLNGEILKSNKAPLFLSLLFKSLKADVNKVRVATFLNRLMQIGAAAKPNFACGALLLTSETMKHFPALWAYVNESALSGKEVFSDAEDDSGADDDADGGAEKEEKEEDEGERKELSDNGVPAPKGYDMLKRDPQHSGMDESCFWELPLLSKHFHPSTAVMARTLLAGAHIVYNGDPLKDLSAVNFLGKFVQKKAKSVTSKFGKKAVSGEGLSTEFAEMDEALVNPADLFHYHYNERVRKVVRQDAREGAERENGAGGDDQRLLDAMLANGGEHSDDEGEVSMSEDEVDEDSDEASASPSDDDAAAEDGDEGSSDDEPVDFGEEESEEEGEEEGGSKNKKNKKKKATGAGLFASAEDYEERINHDLVKSKEYLAELLEEDSSFEAFDD